MKLDVSKNRINCQEIQTLTDESRKWYEHLHSGQAEFAGWVDLPYRYDPEILADIKRTAEEIKGKCSQMIVVGIGGSYLGAEAVIEALNGSKASYPEIVFAGFSMSAAYLDKIVTRMRNEATCLCVISKSGKTVETLLTYSILKEKLYEKYGKEEAKKRIYVITDEREGALRQEVEENGFKSFVMPSDIGGRYSVLTAVGLLPIAVAGHDICKLLDGAASIARHEQWESELVKYAAARVYLQNQGKVLEVFEYFEANLRFFGEWLRQLFGESEGKAGKGAYPTNLCFSRDLHSIGQYLQQGNQMFFETVIRIKHTHHDFVIPKEAGYPYSGKTLEEINECSENGVISAHEQAGIPINIIQIDILDEYNLGQLIYFFMMSAAISAYDLGVNPFDQPGVEDYKREMRNFVLELDKNKNAE